MASKYEVKFNEVIMLTSSTKKGAIDFMKRQNRKSERIKCIIANIEDKGGKVFNTVFVEKCEGDYTYPITQKTI